MKKYVCMLFAGCLITQVNAQTFQTADKSKDSIDAIVNKASQVFLKSAATVGASVAVYQNGKIYFYNYGFSDKKLKQLPGSQTLYGIASITKTFTGLLLAKAVTEGKVQLDDDIRKYLDGNYPNLEYLGHPVKLYHLITHISRLPNWLSDKAEKPGYTRADFYNDLHHVAIDTLPGVKFQYSNTAAQLLGYILERVYHESYEELLREKITGPLKMNDTKIVLNARDRRHAAKGYNKDGSFNPEEYDYAQGAGGIKSTTADMIRYMAYQMNENDPAVKLSHQESWGFDMGKGDHYSCALNWQIIKAASGLRKISQEGNLGNSASEVMFCPELKTGVVLLSNADDPEPVSKMANDILKQIEPNTP